MPNTVIRVELELVCGGSGSVGALADLDELELLGIRAGPKGEPFHGSETVIPTPGLRVPGCLPGLACYIDEHRIY